jgi:hypothetical protein
LGIPFAALKGVGIMAESDLQVSKDFEYLMGFLPEGWREKAKELGALRRCRKVPNAERLLRTLLIHLAEGCSLRETAVRAREGGILDLSDVAIMDRLRLSGEWFRWMNTRLMRAWVAPQPATVFGSKWKVRVVDGTRIKEPGPTGSSWCVHYCIDLPSLACHELKVAEKPGDGESFRQFRVEPGDLFVGDRAYGVRPSIFHVADAGGEVLTRFAMSNLPLQSRDGIAFRLLENLRTLQGTRVGHWPVRLEWKKRTLPGWVCAVRKNRQATERAQKQVRRQSQKAGTKPRPETLEAAAYTFVFTTVDAEDLRPTQVLEMYRGRWQIEIVFKRLKSILGLGHLRKSDPQGAVSWIQGKLLVAFLIESLIRQGESFFPWGYPLLETPRAQPKPMARGATHAAPAPRGG